jgi:hypothetical protein
MNTHCLVPNLLNKVLLPCDSPGVTVCVGLCYRLYVKLFPIQDIIYVKQNSRMSVNNKTHFQIYCEKSGIGYVNQALGV